MKLSLAVRTVDGTDAKAAWQIRTGATPGRVKLLELGLFLVAATASTIGLGRPAAMGTTPTTPVNFLPEDPDDIIADDVILSALAWGAGAGEFPTAPATFIRRITLPATIGTGVIFPFPEGLVIPASSSVVLWNLSTASVLDCYAVVSL